jgi:hypothetical protein
MALIDVGLLDPLPDRLHAVTELGRDPLDGPVLGSQLCSQRADHPDRCCLLIRGVAPRLRLPGHLLLRHSSILVSKVWSLQETQGGSHCQVPGKGGAVKRRRLGLLMVALFTLSGCGARHSVELGHSSATMTLDTYGHLFEDRLDEVGSAMDAAREASRARRAAVRALPGVAPVLPEPHSSRNDEAAPDSVSAGQDRFSEWYPRPDSNRRYRLERAAC